MRSTLSTSDEVWQQQFKRRIGLSLEHFPAQAKIVLGCSGGMDSMLLFHLLSEICPERLLVVSVDHQLQDKSAEWSEWVAKHCIDRCIAYEIVGVHVAKGNTESQARRARYTAFERILSQGDVLVLAHHQQDQAETVILRMLSGTGVSGLAAMQELSSRISHQQHDYWLWRPLLAVSKQKIHAWMNHLGLDYIRDPMNDDVHYDRVWSRQVLWPVLEDRFPVMQESISRCAQLMHDAHDILLEVLHKDIDLCCADNRLNLNELSSLSKARQRQLLSYWIQADQQYKPPLYIVENLIKEVVEARQDAFGVLHYQGFYFVRYDDQLYRYSQDHWHAFQQLPEVTTINYANLNSTQQKTCIQAVGLDHQLLEQDLQLIPRQGGEKIKLYGHNHHKALKKMIQDAKIPTWLRHKIQILMYHNVTLGVITPQGFWLADSPFCQKNGWQPK